MKTFAVLIPREAYTETDAIVETGFKITKGSIFQQTLTELQDALNEIFALELFTTRQTTALCFTAAGPTIDIICGELYSIVPRAEIREIPDFTYDYDEHCEIATAEVKLRYNDIYPLKGQNAFQIDSMTPILSVLTRFPHEGRFIVQYVLKPVRDTAKHHFNLRRNIIADRSGHFLRPKYWFKRGMREQIVEKITEKCHWPMFQMNMRIAAILPGKPAEGSASDQVFAMMQSNKKAEEYLHALFGGFTEVNTIDLNRLVMGPIKRGEAALKPFQDRDLSRPFRLTPNEIAAIWHPPGVGEGKNLLTLLSKKGSPPKLLPCDTSNSGICFFGKTDYREKVVPFGIKRSDRARHMYVIGKSGTGKSKLLQLLVNNDIQNGYGCAILDPHGDLVDDVLRLIPQHRIGDVVLFDPSDLKFPPSFNPLVQVPDELKMRVTIGFLEIFKKVFSSNWSDRMEHVLRYSIIALLSTPGATLLSIRKMLVDPGYRAVIVENVRDNVVKNFWMNEYPSWAKEYDAEVIAPLINKVGQFVATNMIRNIIGQPINRFDFREIMDTKKILLMKVSKGILGDDNAALLGSMVVAKIYQAAMSRADIPIEQREDFYFYVDEFHTFATSSFDEILSEARKYGLNLTVANQFLGQLPADVRKTLFGNIGSLLAFRVGADDAAFLAHEFEPRFAANDLINLDIRDFYIKMAIDGETQDAFSGRTLNVEYPEQHFAQQCVEASRASYALPLENVQDILSIWESAA